MDEWLVEAMYEGVQTVVRTTEGDSKAFSMKAELHQGSVLGPLLFVLVMEMISRDRCYRCFNLFISVICVLFFPFTASTVLVG